MTCREAIDFLMAYLNGELSADVRGEFERHLAVCPPCVEYLDSYRRTVFLERESLSRSNEAERFPPVPDALVEAILQSRKQ